MNKMNNPSIGRDMILRYIIIYFYPKHSYPFMGNTINNGNNIVASCLYQVKCYEGGLWWGHIYSHARFDPMAKGLSNHLLCTRVGLHPCIHKFSSVVGAPFPHYFPQGTRLRTGERVPPLCLNTSV